MKVIRKTEIDTENYKVGDMINFKLNDGEEVEAIAVKQEDDGMIFYFVDAIGKEHRMNRSDINIGGYENSELRKYLNSEILSRFPIEIREKMIVFDNGDFLRLATKYEIFGVMYFTDDNSKNLEQWEPMKYYRNRIAFRGNNSGILDTYWLQNSKSNYFGSLNSNGIITCTHASNYYGIRPAFKMRMGKSVD